MTDAEKLADYERVVQIIKDQVALEKHMRGRKAKHEAIQFIRADAYEHIVHRVIGPHAFRDAYRAEPTAPPSPGAADAALRRLPKAAYEPQRHEAEAQEGFQR